eukprot:1088407-Karenia_brevis.AAC.1
MEYSRQIEKDKITRLIIDYKANMPKCKDKLLEYGRGLTRGNKIQTMEPFDDPPLRESEGQSTEINSVTRTNRFAPRPGNPRGAPMPNFGGGRKAKSKSEPNPFRSPSPAVTTEKDPKGQ